MFSDLPMWVRVIIKFVSIVILIMLAVKFLKGYQGYPNPPSRQDLKDKDIHPTIRKKGRTDIK